MSDKTIISSTESNIIYFAYGANIDIDYMAQVCPSAKIINFVYLPDYSIIFSGYSEVEESSVSNLIKKNKTATPGILYSMTSFDLRTLEGLDSSVEYYASNCSPKSFDGKLYSAITHKHKNFTCRPPTEDYFNIIMAAYKELGFNIEPLNGVYKPFKYKYTPPLKPKKSKKSKNKNMSGLGNKQKLGEAFAP